MARIELMSNKSRSNPYGIAKKIAPKSKSNNIISLGHFSSAVGAAKGSAGAPTAFKSPRAFFVSSVTFLPLAIPAPLFLCDFSFLAPLSSGSFLSLFFHPPPPPPRTAPSLLVTPGAFLRSPARPATLKPPLDARTSPALLLHANQN